ncbi:MAG: hypothetical protein JO318_21760 [Chloroflexi bacterium]|nr:hypothetical protein [Chloroflexota bacterium]
MVLEGVLANRADQPQLVQRRRPQRISQLAALFLTRRDETLARVLQVGGEAAEVTLRTQSVLPG